MEIVSFSTTPVVILVIVSCFCQRYGLSNSSKTDTCEPRDCSQPPRFHGDNPFPCKIGVKADCEKFNLKPWRRDPHKEVIPPQIARVNVYYLFYASFNQTFPVMNVTLRLPEDEYSLNRTKAVKLSVNSPDQSNYTVCRIFDFRNATFTKKDATNPRYLMYPCFCGLKPQMTGTFILTVISLPDDVKVDYYATVPVKSGKWRSSLVMWQPSGKEEFWVMFDRHPDILKYSLSLYSYDRTKGLCGNITGSTLVKTEKVDKDSSNTVVFKSLVQSNYFATITPLCEGNCETLISHCLQLQVYPPTQEPGDKVVDVTGSSPVRDTPIITHIGLQHNDRAIKTILGVVCGVIAGVLLVVFLAYLYQRKEQPGFCPCIPWGPPEPSPLKEQPTVLLLYSSDCPKHTNVVEKLEDLLKERFNCNVHCDISQIKQIQQKGLQTWLLEKINVSDFIIFVCSVGGRLQCNGPNRRMQLNYSHPVENYFCAAVDEVTKLSRDARKRPENIAVICMAYSSSVDIPRKLDSFRRFVIQDSQSLVPLYSYLRHADKKPDLLHSQEVELFLKALADANTFFQENPQWVNNLLDKKTPAQSRSGKKSRLNNAVIQEEYNFRDEGWNPRSENYIKNRSHSQPHSLHSSDGSYKFKEESSRSLTCLSKHGIADDAENARLLRCCSDSEESGREDPDSRILSMPVEIHQAVHGSSSSDVRTSDSSEFDVADVIEVLKVEDIKKIVNPSSYNSHACLPFPDRINSIPMAYHPPRTRSTEQNVYVTMETDRSTEC